MDGSRRAPYHSPRQASLATLADEFSAPCESAACGRFLLSTPLFLHQISVPTCSVLYVAARMYTSTPYTTSGEPHARHRKTYVHGNFSLSSELRTGASASLGSESRSAATFDFDPLTGETQLQQCLFSLCLSRPAFSPAPTPGLLYCTVAAPYIYDRINDFHTNDVQSTVHCAYNTPPLEDRQPSVPPETHP